MANWISRVADERQRLSDEKEREASEAREIRARSGALIKELETRVQRDVDHANKELYDSAKVFEVRRDMGLFDENRANDFVAMTADYPAATMYVKLYPDQRVLTGTLTTKKDSESNYRDEQFIRLPVTLDENGNAVIRGLDLDDVARIIVEPVVTVHTGAQPKREVPKSQPAAPVTSSKVTSDKSRFSFVADARIAGILERDYEELQRLDPDKSTKAVLVLSGGIIEGLLFDALVANGNFTFEAACNEPLKNMIYPAVREKIIKQDKLTDVLRSYRNLIHPAREVKDNLTFTTSDAKLAMAAVDIILREVLEWHSNRRAVNAKSKAEPAKPTTR